jgi:propanol-preferring alcohol dehydrogenase
VRSVTANTRADGEEFLRLTSAMGIAPSVQQRPLAQARATLADLARDAYTGAAVLVP